jgi:hypothetical protein
MTAFRLGFSSARLCQLVAVLLAASACAATQPTAKGGASDTSDARLASPSPAGGKGGSPSPIPGVADPSVTCRRPFTGTAIVLIGQALYDVTDPVHPRPVCLAVSRSWTPEDGLAGQAGAGGRSYLAGLSPDGTEIAYTGFADAVSIRVYVYDLASGKTRILIDQSRSEVTFVKDGGWVWYLEEAPCANCAG